MGRSIVMALFLVKLGMQPAFQANNNGGQTPPLTNFHRTYIPR